MSAGAPFSSRLRGLCRASLLYLALTCAFSTPALAQTASANARLLFREARQLMSKGKFEEACPKLEESRRLDDGMGTQFNLAHCWEKVGRTTSAWSLFLDVASAANAAGQKKRETAARQRANALEPKLTRIQIDVSHPAPGLTVRLAGQELGKAAWGTAMAVDPGSQRLEASAPGRLTWSDEVQVSGPGQTVKVTIPTLEFEKVEPEPESPRVAQGKKAKPEVSEPERDEGGGMSTARVASATLLAVVGVGGLATGTWYGLQANSETAKAKELCNGGDQGRSCDRGLGQPNFDGGTAERSEVLDHREKADRNALISYIGWGVGGAGLLASVIVIWTAPSDGGGGSEDEASLKLVPNLSASSLGATLSGKF
jgi:hypothetical protein